MIGTFPALNLDINDYPAIKKHLEQFLPKLNQTGETYIDAYGKIQKTRKKNTNKWFETQDSIKYWNDFFKPKIVWTPVNGIYSFSYLKNEAFGLNSIFMITSNIINLKYLLGIFNASITQLKSMQFFTNLGTYGNYAYGSKESMKNLPIPNILQEYQNPIGYLTDYIAICYENKKPIMAEYFAELIDIAVLGIYFEKELQKVDAYITDGLWKFIPELNDTNQMNQIESIYKQLQAEPYITKAFLQYKTVSEVQVILNT